MFNTATASRPVTRQIYRAVLSLRSTDDPAGCIELAYDLVLSTWLEGLCRAHVGKGVDDLYGRWLDDDHNVFESDGAGIQLTPVITDDARALRVVYKDENDVGWIYNIGFFELDSRANIDVQTFRRDLSANGHTPRSLPECLRPLLSAQMVSDVRPLQATPTRLQTREDVVAFVAMLKDSDRRLPVILASEPLAIEPDALARDLYGVAHVFHASSEMSFAVTDLVGKEWSAYFGGIRTYRVPFMPERQDRRAHPLALLPSIVQRGIGPFTESFIDNVYRNAASDADRFPHHDVLALQQVLLQQRRNAVAPAPKTTPPAAMTSPEAPPSSAPATVDVAEEAELLRAARDVEQARTAELEAQVGALQSANEALENDYFALLAEFEEYKRTHSEEGTSFAALLQAAESLPGSAEIKTLITGLQNITTGLYGLLQDARVMNDEMRDLRQRNYALQARVGNEPLTLPESTTVAPEPKLDPTAVSAYVESRFQGRLVLHPRALDGLKDTPYYDPHLLYEALRILAFEYRDMRLRGDASADGEHDFYTAFYEQLRNAGLYYSGSMSKTELPKYHQYYHVTYEGHERFLNKHLRNGGNTADPKRCFRCYFFFDDVKKVVVVGWLPGHLPNSLS